MDRPDLKSAPGAIAEPRRPVDSARGEPLDSAPGRHVGRTIPSLDGLRGVSIILVMIAHLQDSRGTPGWLRWGVFDRGLLGVKVFFVVSGFLITRLILEEIALTGRLSLKLFYIRRVLRIFPAFYVYLAVLAVLCVAGIFDVPAGNFLFAATYTMNFVEHGYWETGHLWSLAVEEQFYLLWPFTIVALGSRRALVVAALMAVLAPYALLALYLHGASVYMVSNTAFPLAFDGIAAGCVLGGVLDLLLRGTAFRRAIEHPLGDVVPFAVFYLEGIWHHTFVYHAVAQLAGTIGICYCVARYTQVLASPGARLLNWAPLVWVGRRSYSLYLWQQPFLNRYYHSILQTFPASVACAVACAAASYRFIELPFNRLRGRFRAGTDHAADS
jgi:peptidoglycan/LPS O-acetylase OafA/YrhL